MKSLLWKDYRLNRLLLIFGFVVCVGPWVISIARYIQLRMRWEAVYGGPEFRAGTPSIKDLQEALSQMSGPEFWVSTSSISLGLSLITIAMLGGNAIAAERADRSAEFLAYLPVSRWTTLTSKSLIALPPVVGIWMVNLAFLFLVAPRLTEGVSVADMAQRPEVHEALCLFVATTILLFGACWFWSVILHSHGLATGMGFFVLAVVVLGMLGIDQGLGVEGFFTNESFFIVSLVIGIGGYVAGCAYYLHRLEP